MSGLSTAAPRGSARREIPLVAAHSLRQNALWMGLGQTLTWTLTALTLALLPRYFGAENLGRIGVGVAFAQLAMTIAGLGMATLITREVARDRESVRELLSTALWLHLAFGSIGGLTALGVGFALGYESLTWIAIAVLAFTVPMDLISILGFATLQGLEVMRYHAVWDVAGKLTHLVGLCAVVFLDLGLIPYLGVSFVAALVPSVAAFRLMRRFAPFEILAFSPRRAIWVVRRAVPIGAVNIVLIVYLAIDVILLSRLADESAAGVYAAPMRVFGTLLFAPTIIATVLFPRLSATAVNDRDAFLRLCDGAIRVVLGVTVLAAIGAATVGRSLVVDIFGGEFTKSGAVLAVMAIALVPTSLNMIGHRILVALDRQAIWTWVMLGALALKIALDAALIPLFSSLLGNPALGAATALAAAEAAMMVVAIKALPAGILVAGLRSHAVRLAIVASAALAVALATESRGVFVSGGATALTIAVLALATRTYTIPELISAIRAAMGRSAAAAVEGLALPGRLAEPPLLFELARLKENRAASPHRGLHLVNTGEEPAAPPAYRTVAGPRAVQTDAALNRR